MDIECDTQAEYRRSVIDGAASDYADHVLSVQQGDGPVRMYRCGLPGSAIYSYRVVCTDGWIAVFGDIGDMILSVNCGHEDGAAERWICGASKSPGYVIEKMRTKPERVLLLGAVTDYVSDMGEKIRGIVQDAIDESPDDGMAICHAVYTATGDPDFFNAVTDEAPVVYRIVAALQQFAILYRAHRGM